MTRWSLTLAALASAIAAPARRAAHLHGQAPFEGRAVYRIVTDDGRSGTVTWLVKGKVLRQDLELEGAPPEARGAYVIVDAGRGRMTSVIPSRREYATVDLATLARHAAARDTAEAVARVSKTGESDRIAGHACDHYVIGERQEVDVCLARGLGSLAPVAAAGGGMGPLMESGAPGSGDHRGAGAEYARLFREGLFPLQVSRLDGGRWKVVMEATEVVRMPVPASALAVPKGYRRMARPAPGEAP